MSLVEQYNQAEAAGNYKLADELFDQIEKANEEAALYAYGE